MEEVFRDNIYLWHDFEHSEYDWIPGWKYEFIFSTTPYMTKYKINKSLTVKISSKLIEAKDFDYTFDIKINGKSIRKLFLPILKEQMTIKIQAGEEPDKAVYDLDGIFTCQFSCAEDAIMFKFLFTDES